MFHLRASRFPSGCCTLHFFEQLLKQALVLRHVEMGIVLLIFCEARLVQKNCRNTCEEGTGVKVQGDD